MYMLTDDVTVVVSLHTEPYGVNCERTFGLTVTLYLRGSFHIFQLPYFYRSFSVHVQNIH